ncbi:MAG: hypothetical protein HQL34_13995, partial [Alphaproteobacteria bacterium]|nr:hypothetical protein [Alphaproteobacteria bacterium]
MINLDVAPLGDGDVTPLGDGDVAPFGDGERHAALDPARPDHLHGLARSLARAGESDAAAEACAWAVALRPDSVVNRQEAGRLMTLLGRTAEAMAHYREALSLRASDPSSMLPLAVLIIDGDGDLSLAIDLLRQCLRASPEDPTPHFHLGRAWTLLGETRGAGAGFGSYLEMGVEDYLGAGAGVGGLG